MYTRSEYYRDLTGATASIRLLNGSAWTLTMCNAHGRPFFRRTYKTRRAARSIMGRYGEDWRLQNGPLFMVYVSGQYKGQTHNLAQANNARKEYSLSGRRDVELLMLDEHGRESVLYSTRRIRSGACE